MRIGLLAVGLLLFLSPGFAAAAPLSGEEVHDVLFRNGTLDRIDRDARVVYRRQVSNRLHPPAAARETGDVVISFRDADAPLALLEFRQGGQHRKLGSFPAAVGNPIIMYFYESVVRTVAETTGGNPFYIRNRMKEALARHAVIETGQAIVDGQTVATRIIRHAPFVDDPNRGQMHGLDDLVLTVTMSEGVPGWYVSLVAEAGRGNLFRSELHFDRVSGGAP